MPAQVCVHCNKDCKNSDSRPYPNSKSSDRIHNRCYIKKSLADRQKSVNDHDKTKNGLKKDTLQSSFKATSSNLIEQLAGEQERLKKEAEEKRLCKVIESREQIAEKNIEESNQFFFDMKAGVAKPHEKKRFLHHKSLSEIVPRYDDHGFQEESIGRTYDHTGRDLSALGESDDDDAQEKNGNDERHKSSAHYSDKTRMRSFKKRKSDCHNIDYKHSWAHKKDHIRVDDTNPCWFCLSSPNIEKHLIITIGKFCYLTLAKGGLQDRHLLILPIEHIQSITSDENSTELLNELAKFKRSLVRYFEKQREGVVFFERNFRSVHWQLQVVPVPLETIEVLSQKIKSISKNHIEKLDYIDIPEDCPLDSMIPSKSPYFSWQIEPVGQRFVCRIQVKNSFFPIQFGRMVLADQKILNCESLIDWKSCTKNKDDYIQIVKTIKQEYESFNFTNNQ